MTLTDHAPLPFEVARAVSYVLQAQFHPGRYHAGLAKAVVELPRGRVPVAA